MALPMSESTASPTAAPAARVMQQRFSDFDEIAESIPDFDSEYVQTECGVTRCELTRIGLERLSALRFDEVAPGYVYRATAAPDTVTLAFLGKPSTDVRWRGGPVTSSHLVGYGPGAEHVGHSRGSLQAFTLQLGKDALERHAEKLGYELHWAPCSARSLLPEPRALDGLRQATHYLFSSAESVRWTLDIPEFRRAQEEAILTSVVHSVVPARERAEQASVSHERAVRRAVEVLEARADEPVYLSELCEAAAVSERTLRSAFQRIYGVSPIRFLHLHRMTQVRRALLRADPTTARVSEVAARFGFANLGRFAVEFRQLFGQSPSKLLRSQR